MIKAERVIKNGTVYTVDQNCKWAQGIAIAGGKIILVGNNEEVEQLVGPETEVVELNENLVLPGFIDAHSHPSHGMDYFGNINLYLLDSIEKYQQAIAEYISEHPEKTNFRGSGWSDVLFTNLGPGKEQLDQFAGDRPAALVSYDGHSLWVNSTALRRAGITKDTADPDGGVIERDPDSGEPSGTLRETAMNLVEDVFPEYSIEERVNALNAYQEMALQAGVTMTHDAMLDAQSITAFKELEMKGRLEMRFRGSITMQPDLPIEKQINDLIEQKSNNKHPRFQTNTAKIFVDGVVEGGTAYLLEPYQDRPEFTGIPIWNEESLKDVISALDKEKVQIHLHVIGDAAVRIALDAVESAQKSNGRWDSRHILTHLQLVDQEDIERFHRLGVIGIPNPYWFKIDDYYHSLALPYLGAERADRQYPMNSFFDAGVAMASASDFPVTIPFDPVIGIQLGMTRSQIGGSPDAVLWPEERVSLEQMIASFTINGAYANFLEDQTGSLEAGKQADLIVLDKNLFKIPPTEIADSNVLLTYVGGQEVYRAEDFSSNPPGS